MWLPEHIPVLVPGQEWRTLWDTGKRAKSALPDRHDATITYRDSQGESYTVEAVLDWRFVKDREMVTIYGAHDAAKALREMGKAMANWREGPTGGLSVFVRDGDAKDQRQREHLEAWRAARDAAERAGDEPQPPPR